jgi:NADH:ubiquinone oxidoreductase subunit 2 (subunit N)
MTLLPFLAVTAVGVVLCLATRRSPEVTRAIGAAGLLAAALTALLIGPGDQLTIGGARIVATPFLVLWIASASASLLLLHLLSLVTDWQRNVPLVTFAGLAAIAGALALTDLASALLVAASGALLALATTIRLPASMAELRWAGDSLRLTSASAALALLAAGWTAAGEPGRAPIVVAVAYLLLVAALVQRMGAVPLHLANVHAVRGAPLAGVPLLIAWLPAAFAVVALSWHQFAVLPLQPELGPARDLAVVLGLATIILAGVAALLQEDLATMLGYTVAQDGAFVLLALAQSEPSGSTLIRAWLLVFALTKTATVGLILALAAAEGTRRLSELAGWARRMPLLAGALLLIILGTYGLPGLLPFQMRIELIADAVGGPVGFGVLIVALAPAVAFGRLLAVGLRTVGGGAAAVPAAAGSTTSAEEGWAGSTRVTVSNWQRWLALPERPALPPSSFREEYEDEPAIYRERARRAALVALREVRYLPTFWAANRTLAAALLVLLLALMPAALVVGIGDLRGAAAGPPPIAAGDPGAAP